MFCNNVSKKEILINLKKQGRLEDRHIRFEWFKPFLITKTFFENRDYDQVLILESGNKRFEFWACQNLIIPPWQTHWFQLSDSILLRLQKDVLINLVLDSMKKAGNINRLSKELKMSQPSLYNLINKKGVKMVSVKKLRRLLTYLDADYGFLNKSISYTKKGDKISIQQPKFPIDLANPKGAALLGMVVSDGCIYVDKKARNVIRTKYSTGERESIDKFIKIINQVYGRVHFQKEWIRNCDILRIGSSIIGSALLKSGAILGHKAKINGEVPWLVTEGDINLKKGYLRAVFEDEASVYPHKNGSYINLSRNNHLRDLTKEQVTSIQKLEILMIPRKFPTGHVTKIITFKTALEHLGGQTKVVLLSSTPRLLLGESALLKELGIENRIHGSTLTLTPSKNYSTSWTMFISQKESIKKFYKQIGFSLKDKQAKLVKCLGV